MELTLKYFHDFGDWKEKLGENLNTCNSWDILRAHEGAEGQYYIPDNREAWCQIGLSNEILKLRAKALIDSLGPNIKCIHSFGVGAAYLEFLMKKENPSLRLKCSDFAPQGIERLKKVFVEADDIFQFNMIDGDWSAVDPEHICLLYRVDTVFDDRQWRKVFNRMKDSGIKEIVFVPSDILTLKKILYFQLKRMLFKLTGRRMTFSGFLRTKQRLKSLLSEFYEITRVVSVGDLTGFLLKLRTES